MTNTHTHKVSTVSYPSCACAPSVNYQRWHTVMTLCFTSTEASGCRSTDVNLAENQLCLPNPMPNITCIDHYILNTASGVCEGMVHVHVLDLRLLV